METVGTTSRRYLLLSQVDNRPETRKLYCLLEENMRRSLIAFGGLLLITACSPSPPEFEIVGRSASDNESLGDYTVRVECDIRNGGGSGRVTVVASVDAANGAWTKRQSSVIDEGESREFTFVFPEVEYQPLGDNSFEYNCRLE